MSSKEKKMERAKRSIVKLSAFYIKKIDHFAQKKIKEIEHNKIQKEYKVINELTDQIKEKEKKEGVKLMPKEDPPPKETKGTALLRHLTTFRIKLTNVLKKDLKPEKKEELKKMPTLEESLKFGPDPSYYEDMEEYIAEEIEKDPEMEELLNLEKQREELEKEKKQLEIEKEKNGKLEEERKELEDEKKKLEVEKEKQKEIEKERERLKKEMEKLREERKMMKKLVEERKKMEDERRKLEEEREKQQEKDQQRMKELEEESKRMDQQLQEERLKVEEERRKREKLEEERMEVELERNKIEEEILKKALENSKKKLEEEKKRKDQEIIKKEIEDEQKKINAEKERLKKRREKLEMSEEVGLEDLKELAESKIDTKILEDDRSKSPGSRQSRVLEDQKKSIRESILVQGDLKKKLFQTLKQYEQNIKDNSIAEVTDEEESDDSQEEMKSEIKNKEDSNSRLINDKAQETPQFESLEEKRNKSRYGSFLGERLPSSERPSIILTTSQNNGKSDYNVSVDRLQLLKELQEEKKRLEAERKKLEKERKKVAEKEITLKAEEEKVKIEDEKRKLELEKLKFKKEKELDNKHSRILTERDRLELEKSMFEKEKEDFFKKGQTQEEPTISRPKVSSLSSVEKDSVEDDFNSRKNSDEKKSEKRKYSSVKKEAKTPKVKKGKKKKQYSSVQQAKRWKPQQSSERENASGISSRTRAKSKDKPPRRKISKNISPEKRRKIIKKPTEKKYPKRIPTSKKKLSSNNEDPEIYDETPLFDASIVTGLVQNNDESFTKRKSMFESATSHSSLGLNNLNIDDDSVMSEHSEILEDEKTKSLLMDRKSGLKHHNKNNSDSDKEENDEKEYATFGTNKPEKEKTYDNKNFTRRFSDTEASMLTVEKGNIVSSQGGMEDSIISDFPDFGKSQMFDSDIFHQFEEDGTSKRLRMLSFHLNKLYRKARPKISKEKLWEVLHQLSHYCRDLFEGGEKFQEKVKERLEQKFKKITNLKYLKFSDLQRPRILKAKVRAAQQEAGVDQIRLSVEILVLFLKKMMDRRKAKKRKKYLKRNLRRMARQIYKIGKKALKKERRNKRRKVKDTLRGDDPTQKFQERQSTNRSKKSSKLDKTKNIFDTSNNISAIKPVVEIQDKTNSLNFAPSKDTLFSRRNHKNSGLGLLKKDENNSFGEKSSILRDLRASVSPIRREDSKLRIRGDSRGIFDNSAFNDENLTGIDPVESRFLEVGELTVGDEKEDMDPDNQRSSQISMMKLSLDKFKEKMNMYEQESKSVISDPRDRELNIGDSYLDNLLDRNKSYHRSSKPSFDQNLSSLRNPNKSDLSILKNVNEALSDKKSRSSKSKKNPILDILTPRIQPKKPEDIMIEIKSNDFGGVEKPIKNTQNLKNESYQSYSQLSSERTQNTNSRLVDYIQVSSFEQEESLSPETQRTDSFYTKKDHPTSEPNKQFIRKRNPIFYQTVENENLKISKNLLKGELIERNWFVDKKRNFINYYYFLDRIKAACVSPFKGMVNMITISDVLLVLNPNDGKIESFYKIFQLKRADVLDFIEGDLSYYFVCTQNELFVFQANNNKKLMLFVDYIYNPKFNSFQFGKWKMDKKRLFFNRKTGEVLWWKGLQEVHRINKRLENKPNFKFTLKQKIKVIHGNFEAFMSFEEETEVLTLMINQKAINEVSMIRLELQGGNSNSLKINNFGDFGDIQVVNFKVKKGLLVISGIQKKLNSPTKSPDSYRGQIPFSRTSNFAYPNCLDFYKITKNNKITHLTRKNFKPGKSERILEVVVTPKKTIFCFKIDKCCVYKIFDDSEIKILREFEQIHSFGNNGYFSIDESNGYVISVGEVDGSVCLMRDLYGE